MHDGTVIDPDVHHTWASPAELVPYLPAEWRDYAQAPGGYLMPMDPAVMTYPGQWGTNKRLDTYPEGGGPPGSDYDTLRTQLLDPMRVERAVLSYDIGTQSGLANPYFAAAVCRAANDWSRDRWLGRGDERLAGAILVPTELPEAAAEEVRRLAHDPRFVEVLVVENTLGKPFGHPAYHPILAAAAEAGLPVAIHSGGELIGRAAQPMAGGIAGSRLELMATVTQPAMHHVASLVTHGVFERVPSLRVLFVEHGFTWLPSLLWNLDARYEILRRESPWVRRRPSEYVVDHVRFTTQPFDLTRDRSQLVALLEAHDGLDEVLCFASDYPHWDADEPSYVASRLPAGWERKVFHDNAAALLERAC